MNEFAKNLCAMRKEKGWTQTELADKLGVTNQAISKWEKRDSFPDTAILIPLSELFGVTVDSMLKDRYRTCGEKDGVADCEDSGACVNDCPRGENGRGERAESRESGDDIKGHLADEIVAERPAEWRKAFAAILCAGLGVIFAAIIEIVLVGILIPDFAVYGTIVMLALIAAGVTCIVYAGIKNTVYFLSIDDERWKPAMQSFAKRISVGVCLCVLSAAAFTACGLSELYPSAKVVVWSVALTVGFALIFAAVALLIVGGLGFSNAVRECAPEYARSKKKETGLSRFSGLVMLVATGAFLSLGFLWNLWHPGWVVFPLGGILCAILGAIDDASGKRGKDD